MADRAWDVRLLTLEAPVGGYGHYAGLLQRHHVGVRAQPRPQQRQFRGIVLRIAVGIENQILGGAAETGLQGGALTKIDSMANHGGTRPHGDLDHLHS